MKKKQEKCYWSVGVGKHAFMVQTLINSLRAVGVEDDFYALCDRTIEGAINHPIKEFSELDQKIFFFKFTYLKSILKDLNYRYFIFLDADNYAVGPPKHLLDFMKTSPIHSFLESDCTKLPALRQYWHGTTLPDFVMMMRQCGITSENVYNVNAGLFIVERQAINTVCGLAEDFWQHGVRNGHVFTDEACLAYATQMLCENPQNHLLRNYPDIWCSDWTGHFAGRIPDDKGWVFTDYMSGEHFRVNPAIIHAIKSKEALIAAGQKASK
jgi:hypothetical protein